MVEIVLFFIQELLHHTRRKAGQVFIILGDGIGARVA